MKASLSAALVLAFPVLLQAQADPQAFLDPARFEPPKGSTRWCDQHLSGAPQPDGRPGPAITWVAYHTTEAPEAVAAFYERSLAQPEVEERGCRIWRFPSGKPTRLLEVCPVGASGPWLEVCPPAPAKARTVVMVSSMARAD